MKKKIKSFVVKKENKTRTLSEINKKKNVSGNCKQTNIINAQTNWLFFILFFSLSLSLSKKQTIRKTNFLFVMSKKKKCEQAKNLF